MINTSGAFTVMDRGVTLNWEDGPTLHHITARVHYHTRETEAPQVVAVQPSQRLEENPFTFEQVSDLHVIWQWRTGTHELDNTDTVAYWAAQLLVTNKSTEDVYIDDMEVLLIDSQYSGQFNLGASAGTWRCALEGEGAFAWQSFHDTPTGTSGFQRHRALLIQPTLSTRTHVPVVLILAQFPVSQNSDQYPVSEIRLDILNSRFGRMVAVDHFSGTLLPPDGSLTSIEYLISTGDDPEELLQSYAPTQNG